MFQYTVFLLFLVRNVNSNVTSECDEKELPFSYLDIAVDMITKAKANMTTCPQESNYTRGPIDCADVLRMGQNKSGVYTIWPMNRLTEDEPLDVYCDMDTLGGGWTLIQRRGNFQRPADYFYKDWKSYKEGFGDAQRDFWLGNDNIFALTNQKLYSVRFDLHDDSEMRYAMYDSFWIDDEFNKYALHIADYSGDAGDAMIGTHNNQKFSTKDQNNDRKTAEICAKKYKGAWWYHGCHDSNLNGLYLKGKKESYADGVNWVTWKGYYGSLESTEIKIRPKKFRVMDGFTTTPQR